VKNEDTKSSKFQVASLLLLIFQVYLYTMFPTIAPYRDAGEMATVIHTLSVAHPPGYPLYTLIGKIFVLLIPFGNVAYRLNLMSGIFSVLTAIILFRIITKVNETRMRGGNLSALIPKSFLIFSAVIFAFSYLQWYLSLVSEMYTLNTFFSALLIYLSFLYVLNKKPSTRYVFAFLYGLSLGNRMDLLLLAPGFIYLFWKTRPANKINVTLLIFFLLGLSIYLYLPIRSAQSPVIDWNHTANLNNLWSTLTRKTHGGTLDLISAGYAKGENFIPDMLFYFRHLFEGFAYIGPILGIIGLVFLWRNNRMFFITTLLWFICSGPLFIYLGNMPPNTHALAVLEAHFLLPNVIFFIWIVIGLIIVAGKYRYSGYVIVIGLILVNLQSNYNDLNKRTNFFAYDYANNVSKSMEKDSIVVLKEDVQLFSMWHEQKVKNKRKDISIIAQGLAGSKWFQKANSEIYLTRLDTTENWQEFLSRNNRQVYVSGDVEINNLPGYNFLLCGLVSKITNENPPYPPSVKGENKLINNIYHYRGRFDYDAYKEFFTPDLIEEYAKAYHKLGYYCMVNNNYDCAIKSFRNALAFKSNFPISANHLGFIYFTTGDFKEAEKYYILAVKLHKYTLILAKQYNTMPDVVSGIKNDFAETYLNLGVVEERLGKDNEALACYSKAINVKPDFAKAYFNKSVIYWKQGEWEKVIIELQNALSIDPHYREAQYYLNLAKQKK